VLNPKRAGRWFDPLIQAAQSQDDFGLESLLMPNEEIVSAGRGM